MKNSQTSCWHGGRHWRSSGPISHKRRKRSFLPHPWQSPPHLSSLLFVALKDSTAYCQFCQLAAVVFTLSLLSSFLSFSTVCLQAVFVFFFLLEPGSMLCSSCCFRCDFAVVDPGEVPPLILRPNRKKIFWRPPPSPPPYLKFWIQHCFVPNLLKILLCACIEMVTVASSPRPSSAAEVETDTEYLKTARKGGGHKGW